MTVALLLLPIFVALIATLLAFKAFISAIHERNEGRFWDGNNPSGFHRFVPPTFAVAVSVIVWASVIVLAGFAQI